MRMKEVFSLKKLLLITILLGAAFSIICDVGKKDDGTGTCIPSSDACAEGYHDDGSGKNCIAQGAQCADGFRDDGSGQVCLSASQPCPKGYKDDGSGKRCIQLSSPCTTGYRDAGNGTCTVLGQPCAQGYRDDGTGQACISFNETCADDYTEDQIDGTCILNCTVEQKNNGQGVCVDIDDNCAFGYTSDDFNTTDNCNACDQLFKNDGTGKCAFIFQLCAVGYKDNGQNVCVLQSQPCADRYTSDGAGNNCYNCSTGYRDNGEGICILPTDPCAIGYKENGAQKCVDMRADCAEGFKDDGYGLCVSSSQACGPNFQQDGDGNCILAIDEDVIDSVVKDPQGKLARCDPLCYDCNAGGICKTCRVGYALKSSSKRCVPCVGCLTCDALTPNECTSCFPPQVLNKTSKTCVTVNCIVENCLQCNLDATCKTCVGGYTLKNNQCNKCLVENCKDCKTSLDTCDENSCFEGYIYYAAKSKCLPCATGCKGCKLSDVSQCVGCNTGYYSSVVDSKNTCSRCFDNCDECSNATKCTKCSTGYIVSQNGSQCQIKCSDSCATCDSSNPDKCLSCYAGATLNADTSKCVTNLSCNSTANCSACSQGYVIASGQCYKCNYTASNCVACTYQNLNTCAKCASGFYLQNGQCVECNGNCSLCLAKNGCIKCVDSFYLVKENNSPTGTCKSCDTSCLTCSFNQFLCTSCPESYILSGSSCLSPNRVTVFIKLGIPMQQFIAYYDSLILWFISKVSSLKNPNSKAFTRRAIILFNIKSGSIDVNTGLQMQNINDVNSVADGLTNSMNSGNQNIDGLVISGSAIGTTSSTTDSNSNDSLGIILGIAIPLGILILIAIIVILVKINARRSPHDKRQPVPQHNYTGKQFNFEEKNSEKL